MVCQDNVGTFGKVQVQSSPGIQVRSATALRTLLETHALAWRPTFRMILNKGRLLSKSVSSSVSAGVDLTVSWSSYSPDVPEQSSHHLGSSCEHSCPQIVLPTYMHTQNFVHNFRVCGDPGALSLMTHCQGPLLWGSPQL